MTGADPQSQGMRWAAAAPFAALYEELMVPALFVPFTEVLCERLALAGDEHVLDVATGTGIVPRTLLRRAPGLHVVGLDLNEGMLELARRASPGAVARWVQGSALELPFADACFDVATCQQGLQFFPDQPRALAELRRVLRPGGRAAVAVWNEDPQTGQLAVAAALRERLGDDVGRVAAAPYAFGPPERLDQLLHDAGFAGVMLERVERAVVYPTPEAALRGYLDGTPLVLRLAQLSEADRASAYEVARETVASFAQPDGTFATQVSETLALADV